MWIIRSKTIPLINIFQTWNECNMIESSKISLEKERRERNNNNNEEDRDEFFFSKQFDLSTLINKHESSINEFFIHWKHHDDRTFPIWSFFFFLFSSFPFFLYRHALHINLQAIIFFLSLSLARARILSLCRAIIDSVTMLKELLIEERKDKIETWVYRKKIFLYTSIDWKSFAMLNRLSSDLFISMSMLAIRLIINIIVNEISRFNSNCYFVSSSSDPSSRLESLTLK